MFTEVSLRELMGTRRPPFDLRGFEPLKDEFMKSTNSRLFEVTELENRSNSVLEEINASNVENAKKIDFIEEFEATTEQKISGQESEIRILSKMLNSKFTHGQPSVDFSFLS